MTTDTIMNQKPEQPPTREVTPEIISFDDLVAFQDNDNNSAEARARLIEKIGIAFGPDGLGLVAVEGVPGFAEKRERLLRLGARLPDLPDILECELPHAHYSTGWSHGREQLAPGQPDWAKGSFYANPWQDSLVEYLAKRDSHRAAYWKEQAEKCPAFYADNVWPQSLPELREAFMDLGQNMMHVGGLLASVCDAYCAEGGVETHFYRTLAQESRNSKGRLLHYFDMSQGNGKATKDEKHAAPEDDMWCGWHNDHVRETFFYCKACNITETNCSHLLLLILCAGLPHMFGPGNVPGQGWK